MFQSKKYSGKILASHSPSCMVTLSSHAQNIAIGVCDIFMSRMFKQDSYYSLLIAKDFDFWWSMKYRYPDSSSHFCGITCVKFCKNGTRSCGCDRVFSILSLFQMIHITYMSREEDRSIDNRRLQSPNQDGTIPVRHYPRAPLSTCAGLAVNSYERPSRC